MLSYAKVMILDCASGAMPCVSKCGVVSVGALVGILSITCAVQYRFSYCIEQNGPP